VTARSDQGQPDGSQGRPERRKSPRFEVNVAARLTTQGLVFAGQLRDICRDAAWIESARECPIGATVTVAMELPGTGGPIEVSGTVIRVGPGEHQPHGLAVLFEDIPPSAATRIDFFVALQGC
jgi:hypothetical protein